MSTAMMSQSMVTNTGKIVQAPVGLFLISFFGTAFGGVVSTLMSVYLPVVVTDLLHHAQGSDLNRISAYIGAIFIAGWTVGGFVLGVLSDRVGRKASLICSMACLGLATMLTGMAATWEWILIFRFLTGFGVGGILVVSNTLMSEAWPEKTRSIYIGILSISFPIGIFSAGMINYFVSGWRQGFLVGILPAILAIGGYWILKESSEWKSGRKIRNREQNANTAVFDPGNRTNLLLGALTFGTMLIGLWGIFSWLPTWVQTLNGAAGHGEGGISMMLLGIGGLSGGFISGWMANAIGLKRSMTICFAVSAVFCVLLFKTNTHFNALLVYSEIAVLSLFFGISQGVLSVFVPLLFPVGIRASATGFCFNIGRIFTAAAVLMVGLFVDVLGGYGEALFVFSLVFVAGLIVLLVIKEKMADDIIQTTT